MSNRRIEEVISEVLEGNSQKNALDFVSYLRTKDITPSESENYWEIVYNGRIVCFVLIIGSDQAPGPWTIWSDQEPGTWSFWSDSDCSYQHKDCPVNEYTKKVAWANVNYCASCGGDCSPGKRKSILGKEFDNVCSSAMAFTNPDEEALDCAKRMVDIRINDILRND